MKKKLLHLENITLKSLQLLFHASPIMCIAFLVFEIVFCLIPIFSAKAISQIVNIFADLNHSEINELMLIVIFYISMNVSMQVLFPIRNNVSEKLSDRIAKDSEMMFNSKIASFHSIYCFENNEFYNEMQIARNGCGTRLISSLQMISSLLRGIITIVLTAGYMLSIHWIIGTISLLAVIPNAFYNFWVSKNRVALFRSRAESSRKLSYLSSILSSPGYAKEVRLFDLGSNILNKYKSLFDTEYIRINKVRRKQCLLGILSASVGAIANGVALILFVNMAINSKTSAGNIVLYTSLLPQFISGLQIIINGVAQTKDNNYYIKHFLDFLKLDFGETNGTLTLPSQNKKIYSVSVNHLSFCYPNAECYALKNINFNIDAPALVAVVGENGSGKSTLIKLLMRLFDPTNGEVKINDIPIKEYDILKLRKNMSGVFQDPARFSLTVRENLKFANIEHNIDDNDMWEACKKAGIKDFIKQTSKGLDTILDKQFEGGTMILLTS